MTPEPNVTLINESNNLNQSSPVEPVFDSGDLIQQAEAERAEIEVAVRSLPRR